MPNRLQTLRLNGCSKLKCPRFSACTSLETLNLSSSQFSNDALLALYADNGVPHLKQLFAKECWGLTLSHAPPSLLDAFVGTAFASTVLGVASLVCPVLDVVIVCLSILAEMFGVLNTVCSFPSWSGARSVGREPHTAGSFRCEIVCSSVAPRAAGAVHWWLEFRNKRLRSAFCAIAIDRIGCYLPDLETCVSFSYSMRRRFGATTATSVPCVGNVQWCVSTTGIIYAVVRF
jgi:hypothetical protein